MKPTLALLALASLSVQSVAAQSHSVLSLQAASAGAVVRATEGFGRISVQGVAARDILAGGPVSRCVSLVATNESAGEVCIPIDALSGVLASLELLSQHPTLSGAEAESLLMEVQPALAVSRHESGSKRSRSYFVVVGKSPESAGVRLDQKTFDQLVQAIKAQGAESAAITIRGSTP
jgi:hypothetical protein